MKARIRPMTAEDKPAIVDIVRSVREFSPEEVAVAEELLDAHLDAPVTSGYLVLAADVNGVVTGYVCYGPAPLTEGTWDIYWVAVDPGAQGQGVGRALMAAAESSIRKSRGRLVLVETSGRPDYARTRQFYRSIGYRQTGRIADFYSPGDDKLILEKRF